MACSSLAVAQLMKKKTVGGLQQLFCFDGWEGVSVANYVVLVDAHGWCSWVDGWRSSQDAQTSDDDPLMAFSWKKRKVAFIGLQMCGIQHEAVPHILK